jgi:diacylglycerol kinase (CTP)
MNAPNTDLNPALKAKSDLHLTRKIWHAFGILAMVAVYSFFGAKFSWFLILVASVTLVPLDFLRLSRPEMNRWITRLFRPVMRHHESNQLSGMTYLFAGVAFLLFLGEKHLIVLTLLFLAFGDPVASFFGIHYGKDRIVGNKTLQGTAAAFVVCTLIAGIYYYFNNLMTERLLIVALISGLIGAIAELIPVGKLDDNFTFPVIAASLLWILFQVYGGFGA